MSFRRMDALLPFLCRGSWTPQAPSCKDRVSQEGAFSGGQDDLPFIFCSWSRKEKAQAVSRGRLWCCLGVLGKGLHHGPLCFLLFEKSMMWAQQGCPSVGRYFSALPLWGLHELIWKLWRMSPAHSSAWPDGWDPPKHL